ncbi:hypothetical protein [Streptomyces sp. NPDC017673]|uniref:hypothetical protein n=1 Tax=unclassified Streptomyces TaxID=2593676 RepID=UPI0037ADB2CB
MLPNGPAQVRTTAEQFPDEAKVPACLELQITPQDLARALFITGRAPKDQNKHGRSSIYEWCHRVAAMPAYLSWTDEDEDDDEQLRRITRTDLARELDPSEKGMLSYTLGQAMCQIFAEKQLSVRFFMHVARYAATHQITFAPGRRRADFFGERTVESGSHTYVVAEAKGRSGRLTSKLRNDMEIQKRTVKTIKGEEPEIAYASAVDFTSARGAMRLTAIDPDEAAPNAIDLPVDPDWHVLAYYSPFLDVFAHQQPQVLGDYVVASFPTLGVTLGVLAPVLQRVERASRRDQRRGLRDDILHLLSRHSPRHRRTLYVDGTLCATDWTLPQVDRLRPESQGRDELPDSLHQVYRSMDIGGELQEVPAREGDFDLRNLSRASGRIPGIFPTPSDLLDS